jgi:hypothetical protein
MLREGDRVRFSEVGLEKIRAMPEAWGLHRALYGNEIGEVTEADAEEQQVTVEFPGGAAHYWDAACFVLLSETGEDPISEETEDDRRAAN